MTGNLEATKPKRKILSLKLENGMKGMKDDPYKTKFVRREEASLMVWCVGGDMPKRVYRPEELHIALRHAKDLTRLHGRRFDVMRTWRAFEPADDE